MRKVNLRLLAILFLVSLSTFTGLYFYHDHQVRRTAGALLTRADRAERDEDPGQAADYLGRYLSVRPEDDKVLARYGLLLAETAQRPDEQVRVIRTLEQVLRNDPGRNDVRLRLVQATLDLQRGSGRPFDSSQLTDPREHLRVLLKATPADGALEALQGEAC